MSKKILIIFLVLSVVLCTGCAGKYKRISLVPDEAGEIFKDRTVSFQTRVENTAKETFSEKMNVYEIKPHGISFEEFQLLAKTLGGGREGEIKHLDGGRTSITKRLDRENGIDGYSARLDKNEITWRAEYVPEKGTEFSMTDEELERAAWDVFNKISPAKGEYEYLGITSARTVAASDGEYTDSVRVSFRKLIDGMRVIGNDICDLYFDGHGLKEVAIHLFDYEKVDETDIISLSNAVNRVKSPDSFSVADADVSNFSGKADVMQIERVKLLWVNQFSEGCEILQPVYNMMGTLKNETGSVEFSSKVIAIPNRYTH